MKLVVIESPFKGTKVEMALYERYLRAAMHGCLMRGEAPYASHGLCTQPGVLDDTIELNERWAFTPALLGNRLLSSPLSMRTSVSVMVCSTVSKTHRSATCALSIGNCQDLVAIFILISLCVECRKMASNY